MTVTNSGHARSGAEVLLISTYLHISPHISTYLPARPGAEVFQLYCSSNPDLSPSPSPDPNPNPNQVLQLYLSYPAAAGEPPLVLRSYRKTVRA